MTPDRPSRLRSIGVAAILFPFAVRAMTADARIPYWDVSPFLADTTRETTLTPLWALALDAIVWLGVALIAIARRRAHEPIAWRSFLLILLAAAGALLHALILTPYGAEGIRGELRSLAFGSCWAAAFAGAWALREAIATPKDRAVLLTTLAGLILLLAAVGAHQVFIQHAQTVADYRADPESALLANGITPGSSMARGFERRLLQPEATGWFGLANVYGALAATALAAFATLALCAREKRPTIAAALAAIAAAAALYLSHSKGATLAAIIGVTLATIVRYAPSSVARLSRAVSPRALPALIAAAAILGPTLLIAIRGLIGERIGELSLLFRAHYHIAALRIFTEHPLTGVGVGGVTPASALPKVPHNPEMIEFAHAFIADHLVTLGLFGLGFILTIALWTTRAAAALITPPTAEADDDNPHAPSSLTRPAILAVLLACAAAWLIDAPAVAPTEGLFRTVGLIAWIAAILLADRLPWRAHAVSIAAAIAAIVAVAHGQVDLAPILTSSAMWWAATIAIAAPTAATATTRRPIAPLAIGGVAALAAVLIAAIALIPVRDLESRLREAAAIAHIQPGDNVGIPSDAVQELEADRWARLADLTGSIARIWPAHDPALDEVAVETARRRAIPGAEPYRKTPPGTRYDPRADQWLTLARDRAADATDTWPGRAVVWATRASLASGYFDAEMRAHAYDAWARVARLEPHALGPRVALAYLAIDPEDTARWVNEALRADQLLRLDPLLRLDGEQRLRLEAMRRVADEQRESHPSPDPIP